MSRISRWDATGNFFKRKKNSIIRETHLRNLRKAMGNVGEQHTVKG